MSYLDNFNVERIDSIPEVKHQLRILKKAIDNNEIGNDSDAYRKPSSGIPATDLSSSVQEALAAAKPNVLISTINIEQGITDDFIQITGDVAVNKDNSGNIIYSSTFGDNNEFGIPSHQPATKNVFSWIRENTKAVYGSWNKDYGIFKYITKEDSNMSDDEVGKLQGSYIILPAFWWKCENIDANHSKVSVAKDYPGEGWNYYDGKYAIPQYKFGGAGGTSQSQKTSVDDGVSLLNNLTASTPTSYISSPTTPANYISQQAGVALSRSIGTGWSLIKYDIHKLMTILCLGYYGRIDVRNYIGKAGDNEKKYHYTQELTENAVICDSIGSVNPDNTVVWGLVDWYNNMYEWVDDLMNCGQELYDEERNAFNYKNGIAVVENNLLYDKTNYQYNLDKTIKKIFPSWCDDNGDCYFGSNALLGKEFDLVPSIESEAVDSDEDVCGWSCYFDSPGDAGGVAFRACYYCNSIAGLASLDVNYGAASASDNCGLRLLYHGEMAEVSDDNNLD